MNQSLACLLKCMGTHPFFPAMFSKGDSFRDFLFAYQEDEDFSKWGLLCSDGANMFLQKLTPIYMRGKNENDLGFLLLKLYPFTLKPIG